ncbi:MAG: nucleotide exchange factor GrpE, partial [Myxococcota bacterium]|nr:nucleotide exchange factor GrpE [Myxococcota bacterium]
PVDTPGNGARPVGAQDDINAGPDPQPGDPLDSASAEAEFFDAPLGDEDATADAATDDVVEDAPPAPPETDYRDRRIATLEAALDERERTLQEYIRAHRKAQNEFDFFKERMRANENSHKEAARGRVVERMLDVYDNLQRSLEASRTADTIDDLRAGIELVARDFLQRLEEMGLDADLLNNPGVSGGRTQRADWFDGKSPTADEMSAVRTQSDASDSMSLTDQMSSIEVGKSRTAREVLIAAEQGGTPRFVARVGGYADSFTNRASGDVYAADIADLRGMVGKPEEAMRKVGWETEWIEGMRAKGRTIYITVIDTNAAGWNTSQIDWAGIHTTAAFDIADPASTFAKVASNHGIKLDDLPKLFDELSKIPPGATPPTRLQPFAEALDEAYGLNNLYSGGGFTVTDKTISGRTGNVGAQEVKVSSGSFELD